MAVEYRLVNDNGVQKVIKLDISEPKKKGMPADTTATVTSGDVRTSFPLRGNIPVAAEEIHIEEWMPTFPGSDQHRWGASNKMFTDKEVPGFYRRIRKLLNLPNRLSAGGWLSKFENGGATQQPGGNKQKRMQELLLIINGAAKELATKQPGDNVAYLAQVMQDPQESELLEAIVAEIPDAQTVLDQVNQMSSQMFKCGGKTKKKVKKGAKGCIPCKKLMRVGGKLVNVWSDCEGNIISKHQTGGWLIPKGDNGLETKYKVSSAYRTNKTGTGTIGQQHYFIGADGNLYNQQVNNDGFWDQGTLVTSGFDDENFKNWSNSLGADSSFWATGFNKDKNIFDTEANARAAMGDAYATGAITGQTVHGVTATGNKYIGDTPDNLKVTADQYVQHHGNWQNAMQAEDDILKAKRRANRVLARERRQSMRDQFRIGDTAGIDFNGDGQIDTETETFTSRQTARQSIRANKKNYLKGAREARANNQMKILGTISNPVSVTGTTPVSTEVTTNDKLAQGGWLTKFQDGGHMDYETKSNISGTTWEQRIDRDNTGALYRYNPGRTSHVVTLQTTGLPIINPNRFVKYGEERYYLTDPKTGRVVKIEGPTIDQRVEEERPVIHPSIIEDHITPEQDIFIFPGGFTKVIPTPVQKETPKKSKKPAKPEKKVETPKQDVPTQPNDNTSTSGSKTPGSIRQGNYPIQESVPAPEGYNPSNEWVEEKDQVNGQIRVTWRNKKTGEISRIKPFKYGGWLNKFN